MAFWRNGSCISPAGLGRDRARRRRCGAQFECFRVLSAGRFDRELELESNIVTAQVSPSSFLSRGK